jgi:flagellar biosynthesis protein FliR
VPFELAIPLGPVEAFVLIATRVLSMLATSPVVSMRSVPTPARLGLGLFTALILIPVVSRGGLPAAIDVSWTAIAGEMLVGALAGFVATVAYSAIAFGASLLDLQAGFSMASVYDANFGTQGALLERFYSTLAALLFFQTNAHHMVIQALVQLFVIVPLGSFGPASIQPDKLATIAAGMFVVAIELIFPVMVALLLTDVALGVLAKVAPQFGIFSIGLQLKVGLALVALIVMLPLLMPRLDALFGGIVALSVAVFK